MLKYVKANVTHITRLTATQAPHLSRIAFPSLPPSHIALNAFNSLVFQYICAEESMRVDWEAKPPEGARKEVAQTELIEGELQIEDGKATEEEELSRKLAAATIIKE